MRPPRSFICARICVSTIAGLATAPPKTPECRSLLLPRTSIWKYAQAAQRVADRRHAAIEHRRIRNHEHVGLEIVPVSTDEVVQVNAANLLFAFDEEPDIDRQAAALFQYASMALMCMKTWPLSSAAPRA